MLNGTHTPAAVASMLKSTQSAICHPHPHQSINHGHGSLLAPAPRQATSILFIFSFIFQSINHSIYVPYLAG
jgi:hypothetical protein